MWSDLTPRYNMLFASCFLTLRLPFKEKTKFVAACSSVCHKPRGCFGNHKKDANSQQLNASEKDGECGRMHNNWLHYRYAYCIGRKKIQKSTISTCDLNPSTPHSLEFLLCKIRKVAYWYYVSYVSVKKKRLVSAPIFALQIWKSTQEMWKWRGKIGVSFLLHCQFFSKSQK